MTIYAIVNTLLGGEYFGASRPIATTLISPSGILQGGNPYFVPDFAPSFEARPALALKIGKLGKGIAPRFAHRYIESATACLLFVAPDLLSELRLRRLPWTQAVSYDRCLAIGKFVETPYHWIMKTEISVEISTMEEYLYDSWAYPFEYHSPEEIISQLSRDNTLKTGDIIIVGLAEKGIRAKPGMQVKLYYNGRLSSKFNIR